MDRVGDHCRWIDNSIEHHYLFEWKQEDHGLSKLVYSLKGWGFSKPYEIFSEIIFNHIRFPGSGFGFSMDSFRTGLESLRICHQNIDCQSFQRTELKNSKRMNTKIPGSLFYPSYGRKKDHALMLAEKLGNRMGISPQPLIKERASLKQALLKRKERQSIEVKTSSWRGTKALLVDDVVTSGATVRACYRALNRPSKLIVWSLFYRKKRGSVSTIN